MKKFSELNIKSDLNNFIGEKIKISKILNREIIIQAFKIEKSKYPKNNSDKVMTLQIEFSDEKHIVFTSSNNLMNLIEKVNTDDYPFETRIVKEGEHFEFR